eukprot:TRINITY_DN6846_c0_g1_i4.p1 TRINITY_DN6846_c0_g1~~TRINITY_DN6846_c0_g1_i4.p1  ORF type:complete len:584 (+),score=34.79 TRINITY_DN6846_c0_g1_i4:683-2434(+)
MPRAPVRQPPSVPASPSVAVATSSPTVSGLPSPRFRKRSHQHLRAQLAGEQLATPRSAEEEPWVQSDGDTLGQSADYSRGSVLPPTSSPMRSEPTFEEPKTPTSSQLPHHTDQEGLTQYILERLNAPMLGHSHSAPSFSSRPLTQSPSPRSAQTFTPERQATVDGVELSLTASRLASPSHAAGEACESTGRGAVQFNLDPCTVQNAQPPPPAARPLSPRSQFYQKLREHARRHEQQLIADVTPLRSHWNAHGNFFGASSDRDPSRNKLVCGLCWKLMHVEQHAAVLPCGHIFHTNCICPHSQSYRGQNWLGSSFLQSGGLLGPPVPSPTANAGRGGRGFASPSTSVAPSVRSVSPSQAGTIDHRATSVADPGETEPEPLAEESEFYSNAEPLVSDAGSIAAAASIGGRSQRSVATAMAQSGGNYRSETDSAISRPAGAPSAETSSQDRGKEKEKEEAEPDAQATSPSETATQLEDEHTDPDAEQRTREATESKDEPRHRVAKRDERTLCFSLDPAVERQPSMAHSGGSPTATGSASQPVSTHVVSTSADHVAERNPSSEAASVPPQATDVPNCPLCWRPRRNG